MKKVIKEKKVIKNIKFWKDEAENYAKLYSTAMNQLGESQKSLWQYMESAEGHLRDIVELQKQLKEKDKKIQDACLDMMTLRGQLEHANRLYDRCKHLVTTVIEMEF